MTLTVIPIERTPSPVSGRFNETDIGNAERLIAQHGDDLHFVSKWGRWIVWDGTRWASDETGMTQQLAKDTVRSILADARAATTREERAALAKHALRSEANGRIVAMLERARFEPGVSVRTSDLDADPWRLAVRNGTLNLRTGELGPHDRGHLITKVAPVRFDADAPCPRWLAF